MDYAEVERQRVESINSLIKEYEVLLADVIKVESTLDRKRLPKTINIAIDLVTAKTAKFSDIGALMTTNYALSHIFGQLRPVINDSVYSADPLTPNFFSILVSKSGSGKDAAYNAVMKACKNALSTIEASREEAVVERAKERALRVLRAEKPSSTMSDVEYADYGQYLPKPLLLRTILSSDTTRGGMAVLLNKMQKESLGVPSAFFGEFGLSLKQGKTIDELFKLLGELYDMGCSEGPEFKSEESKEEPIKNMYPNFLGHTAPKILFGDVKVRESLDNLFHMMLARRCWFAMPDGYEAIENNPIPSSLAEAREWAEKSREAITKSSIALGEKISLAVDTMLDKPSMRTLTFAEGADSLYDDYFGYCNRRAELLPDSSIQQTEMSGRAFKMARLAAIWQLAENDNVITREIMASAIYLAEYNSKYLDDFTRLVNSKPYVLMADYFLRGKETITLAEALEVGYIIKITPTFSEVLEPLNSYLDKNGVCTYEQETKVFTYTPFEIVEEKDTSGYTVSYRKVEGMSKEERTKPELLNNFTDVKENGSLTLFENIMKKDTIYNVFKYADTTDENGVVTKFNRAQENIISNTKLVVIDVDESPVPIEMVHMYLEELRHVICTTSDKENRFKFRILLPVNIEIDGTNPKVYSYVTKRIAADLLVKADPTCFNPAQPMYSYKDSEVFTQKEGELYDVSEYLKEFASNVETKMSVPIPKAKTPAARKTKVNKVMNDVNRVFEYAISAPNGMGSYSLARAALHMIDLEFNKEEFITTINYINSVWLNPMNQDRLDKTLVSPYLNKFQD